MAATTDPSAEGTVSIDHIEPFEAAIGETLPEDYRAFLLSTNGGTPTPDSYNFNYGDEV